MNTRSDSTELPFRAAIADAIGCNAPGEHPECEHHVRKVLNVCERYYGRLPEQSEDSPSREMLEAAYTEGFREAMSEYDIDTGQQKSEDDEGPWSANIPGYAKRYADAALESAKQALRPSRVPSLMHVVSMLDHGNTKVAREEAMRLLNEVRGRE